MSESHSNDEELLKAQVIEAEERIATLCQEPWSKQVQMLFEDAKKELLNRQRALASYRGGEVAIPLEWPCLWTGSSRLIYMFGYRRRNAFFYDALRDTWSESERRWGNKVVQATLINEYNIRIGGPNDEVLEGHPLWGKGIDYGDAFVINNSEWKRTYQEINKAHDNYNEVSWQTLQHFMWTFHDYMVEALAETFEVTIHEGCIEDVVKEWLEDG